MTWNVYAVPFVNPVTVIGLAVVLVSVTFPGLDVTVYSVIALPPSLAGAVKLTVAVPFPAIAVTPVGALGTPIGATVSTPGGATGGATGVTLADAADAADSPAEFVAVTWNVYAVPFVNPVTVIGPAVVLVSVTFPGLDVTVYSVIVLPPSLAGAVKLTVAVPFPAVAVTPVGAPGTPIGATGVTLADAADAADSPAEFVAVTWNVYAVPFVNPVTVIGPAVVLVSVTFPGLDVTVYSVIVLPPSLAGAVKLTVAVPFPAVAVTPVGALGTPIGATGVTLADAADAADSPAEFVAVTWNVYAVPFVNPVTVIGPAVVLVSVTFPGLDVTVYSVIALPPSLAGAVKLTVAVPFPAVAVTPVGALGTPIGATGVTLADTADAADSPAEFVAVTWNVYAVPFVNPVTVIGPAVVLVSVTFPGLDVTVYSVIALPPSLAGAVKRTVAVPFPAVAVTPVGAPGTPIGTTGVTLADAADAADSPAEFVAVTWNVYAVPFVNPVTVIGLAVVLVSVTFPGLDVTVYSVIALPPSLAGAVKLTVAVPFPAIAVTPVGAPGTPIGATGVTLADAADPTDSPTEFVAVTWNVYAVPFVNPVTVIGPAVVLVSVTFPGLDVTVYSVIVLPPSLAGAVKLTVAVPFPAIAVTPVGAPGTPIGATGVTLADAADPTDSPTEFVAVTWNVYAVPFVNPVTVIGPAVVLVSVTFPGLDVTVYSVIVLPPSLAGAVKLTVAVPFPAVAVTPVGALGTETMLNGFE
nr:hypothetical protein [Paenibacillus lycopersici]